MITKTEVYKSRVGEKRGWAFSVYYGRKYPNFASALYKTKKETEEQLERFKKTGEYDYYGSAE
ncbi:MAG: hypothetical protein KAT32_04910 [Candidatus Moranbacteria bacterium]|nr:hypothetical protein [Candidatus Moranbacteria bacterium]